MQLFDDLAAALIGLAVSLRLYALSFGCVRSPPSARRRDGRARRRALTNHTNHTPRAAAPAHCCRPWPSCCRGPSTDGGTGPFLVSRRSLWAGGRRDGGSGRVCDSGAEYGASAILAQEYCSGYDCSSLRSSRRPGRGTHGSALPAHTTVQPRPRPAPRLSSLEPGLIAPRPSLNTPTPPAPHHPGPFAAPFIGNLPDIVRHGLHNYLDLCRRRYGRVFKIYLGSIMFIVVADPEVATKVNRRLTDRMIGPQLSADPKGKDDEQMLGIAAAK
jgi:hypothetical protein